MLSFASFRRAFLALPFFILLAAPTWAADSPLDAVATVQSGVDASDMDRVERGIDIDSVLNSSMDTILKELKSMADKNELSGGNAATVSMLLSAVDDPKAVQTVAVKAIVFQEAKNFIRGAVRGGYLAGKPDPKAAGDMGMFSSLRKGLGKDRKQIVPGKVISQSGDEAVVSASYVDQKAGTFPLRLKVKKENGNWRIKEVANIKEIVEKATNGK